MEPAEKMEKDWSAQVEELIASKQGISAETMDQLFVMEKQTRNSADLRSNARILLEIVNRLYKHKDYKQLNEDIVLLTRKRALLKQAVTEMIQQCIKFVSELEGSEKLDLIDTIRQVTDGKIFVEVERARVTRTLCELKESQGLIVEAADLLQELQVETYGSMDKQEKTDFILEQMRLCMAKNDYTRAFIISKKISTKFFNDPANNQLKIRFYRLMIQNALRNNEYLRICQHYRALYETKSIQDDEKIWKDTLKNVVIYSVMAPHDSEQHDLLFRIKHDPLLSKIPLMKDLLQYFTTSETMRWTKMQQVYGSTLTEMAEFDVKTDVGKGRFEDFHKRIIEHVIMANSRIYG